MEISSMNTLVSYTLEVCMLFLSRVEDRNLVAALAPIKYGCITSVPGAQPHSHNLSLPDIGKKKHVCSPCPQIVQLG